MTRTRSPRKPFGVWMLLSDGSAWMFCREPTLAEALLTARTLRGVSSHYKQHSVWIAAPI